ncbi:MAG: asparagine synthase (glutamine-hydrolyzing) [Candidatus Muirbacterium halophilum]|nr:asparagine synthase (glutamine-hydrolyzing) [Candidatus Muirbacterium halophilum]MCK9475263.1 asparagine synthase (glutamine-hydrolyzing) [Candidatus Muirbacterium halophilum]
MCGFFGIINKNSFNKENVKNLTELSINISDVLFHRGPDDCGIYLENNVFLVHRRLSIIDIDNGVQPMHSRCGRYSIVFNGEIYNFRNLKEKLKKKLYVFLTDSDTEVLLYTLIEYGVKACNILKGMFSFVFIDKLESKIICARDISGEKPLFYSLSDNEFTFSSEIKAFTKYKKNIVSKDSISMFFKFQYIPEPFTVYKDIFKLCAGSFMEIDLNNKKINKEKYFKIKKSKNSLNLKKSIVVFDDLLEKSVSEMLVSDVPVGAFLSGGIDSTLIVRSMRRLYKSRDIHTFSVGFNQKKYDESIYAKKVCKKYNTIHHSIYFTEKDLIENLDIINQFDEPFGDSSSIALYFLAKKTSDILKVVLSGEGSDELFGGYRRYFMENKTIFLRKIPFFIRNIILKIIDKSDLFYLEGIKKLIKTSFEDDYYTLVMGNFNKKEFVKNINLKPCNMSIFDLYKNDLNLNSYEKFMDCDFNTYIPNDILVKSDRMTMLNSIESRAPFLSQKMIDFAYSLPINLKKNKIIPKSSLKSEWSNDFIFRNKQGFGVPVDSWFKEELGFILKNKILNSNNADYFIKKNNVLKMLDMHIKGIENNSYKLWQIFVFIMWLEKNENIICN